MAKKTLEETPVVENGLKDIVVDSAETVDVPQAISLNEVPAEVQSPGHPTRAFRG